MADQSTLKALRNKLSDLEDELDTAHEAQAELEKQVGQLKSDLEAKEEKLQSALTEAKDASERCASSEARLQKLSEAQDAPAEASSPPDSADQSEEVARLRAELQELQRSLKTSQMETKKLEEELKTAEQQQKEAVQQEKKRAEGLTSEIQQLQRSQQETAQAEAQKLKAVEAEHRNECQRLQQLCQELESDRDTALERMQRAEETLKQQMQQFQEFSKKNAAEARAGAEAMGKELEARNARIAQQQAELQRQAQAMAEEQRKAQELQEQLTAYVGTHQELFTRFQSAVEQLDSEKELSKAVALEREERDRAEKEHQDAEQARQDLANAEPPGPAQLAVSDVLISVSFKEVERPLQVKPWDTNFEEVVGAWLHAVQRSEQLQSSLVRYLKHLEETSTAYPLHQDAKLLEVHEQFADAAF